VLPDAGTFWYHPHINETVQLEKGLYGALVVRGHDEPHLDGERVLVLDDLKLDRNGNIARFGGFKERHEGRREGYPSGERRGGARIRDRRRPGRADLVGGSAGPDGHRGGTGFGLAGAEGELLAESGLANVALCQAELAGPGDHRPGGPLPTGSVDLVIDRPGPRRPHRTAVRGHLNYRYMGASVSTESGLGE
jgi:hypothetical protein